MGSNVWTYRQTLATELARDPVGYEVEASDGSIGKIDKRSTETSRAYLVVDTGPWIFGKKRLIPAGVVTRVDHSEKKVYVSMTKDQIKSAPDFDDQPTSYDDSYYENVGTHYQDHSW